MCIGFSKLTSIEYKLLTGLIYLSDYYISRAANNQRPDYRHCAALVSVWMAKQAQRHTTFIF